MPGTPSPLPATPASASIHNPLLEQAIPDWLIQATPQRRQAVKDAPANLPDWYHQASPVQRQAVDTATFASFSSQTQLDKAMADLQGLDAFAAPLLSQALKDALKVTLDVNKTFLRLNKTITYGILRERVGTYQVLNLSLLQAAIHNFEAAECEAGAFDETSGFVVEGATPGTFEPLSTSLTVRQFLKLCRVLNIGALYQLYLKGFLYPTDAAKAKALHDPFVAAQKDAMRAAAEMALLKKDIEPADYDMILSVIAGEMNPRLKGKRVWFRDLQLMKHRLTGCVVFSISDKYAYSDEFILYVPQDPQSPLKRYSLGQLREQFKRQFTARDLSVSGPTAYQRFFSQFVDYADLPDYFSQFTQNGPDKTFDQSFAPYAPLLNMVVKGLNPWGAFNELPPPDAVVQVPEDDPYLDPQGIARRGRGIWADNVDLWDYLFDRYRDKLLGDARSHAVSTADVDAKVRSQKIASLLNIGMLVLGFVPGLGELMMVVIAGQLLYTVFEGATEWSEGDRKAAKVHLVDVAQNLALIAVMGAAGKGIGKLVTVKPEPVIEGLKQVESSDGQARLWKPDLTPYESPTKLPDSTAPNALGQFVVDGKTYIRQDGKVYETTFDDTLEAWRIRHPRRADAYAPQLAHNHEGAWQSEADAPLTWDTDTLLRRMGLPAEPVPVGQRADALFASGVEPDALREAQFNHEPTPLILADTFKRFALHNELSRFIEQMKSLDPGVYAQADPVLQLDLLKRRGMLPSTSPLRVIDAAGRTLWEDAAAGNRRTIVLSANHQARGELLEQVLYTLQGVDPELKEFPGTPEESLSARAAKLRQYLGDQVEVFKAAFLEERYQALTAADGSLEGYPKLPGAIASRLLDGLSAEELQTWRTKAILPEPVVEQARWYEQEARVSRAYEGLLLDSLADVDSLRLALRTLETLPGWRRGVRLELRQYSEQGTLLDAIGSPDQTQVRKLVLMENGQFVAAMPRDFYEAVWEVMSPDERQRLGLTDTQQLKALIQASPLPRAPLRTVLLEHPVRKPAYDPAMRLLGGGRGYEQLLAQGVNAFRSTRARVRSLYPALDEQGISALIETLGDNPRTELARRETEYAALDSELNQWVKAHTHPSSITFFYRQAGGMRACADQIRRCWRRETGSSFHFNIGVPVEMPALTADFSHIDHLKLVGVSVDSSTQTFLKNFSHVKTLKIINTQMTQLPDVVYEMSQLAHLDLSGNKIQLDPKGASTLSAFTHMQVLDLSQNPLGVLPDFAGMSQLKALNLRSTRIDQWPTGLVGKARLTSVDLSNNKLSEVPQAYLNPSPEQVEEVARLNKVTQLSGNPFPDDYWRVLDRYWQTLTQARPDLVADFDGYAFYLKNPLVEEASLLYNHYNVQDAREFVWGLGDGAQAELASRRLAFDQLQQQLNTWASAGGNQSTSSGAARYVRTAQRELNAADSDHRYIARTRILKCWRGDAPQETAADGTQIGIQLDLSGLTLPTLPELDADFSHVGSLKLTHMNLVASPEGMLRRFRNVRWLDLSNNQLRALPPALGEMHGLTRLFLHKNRLRLTPQTAQVLSERTSLRALSLSANPLGITPDFSRIPDMRNVFMSHANLDSWPTGLGEQPLLYNLDLRNNQFTTLPDEVIAPSDEELAASNRVSRVTNIGNNPLSEQTRQQISAYGERLERAGLASPDNPNRLVATALDIGGSIRVKLPMSLAPFKRWARGMPEGQVAQRKAQWQGLREQPASNGFFEVLRDLEPAADGQEDLQRRVWEVIDSITENSPESEKLRTQMFEWAGRAACCDRAALSFSNLEVMTLVYRASTQALDVSQGPSLLTLSRRLFRLDEVEKIALADIDQRRAAINAQPGLSESARNRQLAMLEEVEIKLAYRDGLKDRLDLPGQPQHTRFTSMGGVTPAMLDSAYEKVVALNDSPQEHQALLSREFWNDYITHKYQAQFEALSQPFHDQLAAQHADFEAKLLSSSAHEAKAKSLQAQLAIKEAELIDTLTRKEIAEALLPRGNLEALENTTPELQLAKAHTIEFNGQQYFIASMPDAGDGMHYVLRVQAPDNPFALVTSGIIAKPDAAGLWKRRGLIGGMRPEGSPDVFEDALESMQVTPYTADELDFMRRNVHWMTQENELGAYNRANNGKYPLRDLQGRPIRIRSLETEVSLVSGSTYTSAQIKPYILFEGYERVGALYEEKLQWRKFTADDVKVPGERALIGQSMVVANRRIAKGEIVGIYGGVIMPDGFGLETANTFGVVVSPKPRPGTVGMSPNPTYLVGDTIISRINTHFDYDLDGKPVKQAASGYNVETVAFDIQAEHPASRPGKRTPYLLNVVFATEDIPAGVELRVDYGYSEEDIKIKFG